MQQRDARDPEAYAFCRTLSAAQWAWEFLRRNTSYRAEWAAFDRVWRALEADYGSPPNRDFCAWKLDPRAWVPAADCPAGDCRIDQDKVLIECAMGARWGFHKFPPSPNDDDPVGGFRLVWRADDDEVAPLLGADDVDWLGADPARVAIGFDLAAPLREQIERAKRQLQMLQRLRVRDGRVTPASIRNQGPLLTRMLRLLDGSEQGLEAQALARIDPQWPTLLQQACAVRDGGYRRLAGLPAG